MSQTSDQGAEQERSGDATGSGGAAGTPDPEPTGTAAEAAGDDPRAAEAQRAPRAAEEVEQDDRAGAGDRPVDHAGGDAHDDAGGGDAHDDAGRDARDEAGEDEEAGDEAQVERKESAEEFAAQHDPADHDVAAGEEFRQPGDWVADDEGPQEWDSEGNLVSGGGPGSETPGQQQAAGAAQGADASSESSGASGASGAPGPGGSGRRVSDLAEVRDGGYSVGSAATIDDGAMPLGHPVKGWEDTRSYATPDHPRYDDAEPHVWFTDADAAERAGFHRAD